MILSRSDRKSWRRVQFENELVGAICRDGLLYMFDLVDVEAILNEKHPHNDAVWWFNESRDRECAERTHCGRVTINPTATMHLFGYPVVWE